MANENNNEALTFGILSLVFSVVGFIVLAIVFCPLGFAFGCLGLRKNKHDALSIVGVSLSSFGLGLFIVSLFS